MMHLGRWTFGQLIYEASEFVDITSTFSESRVFLLSVCMLDLASIQVRSLTDTVISSFLGAGQSTALK